MNASPNESTTTTVLQAVAEINGKRAVKPLARLDDIRARTGIRHVTTSLMWLVAEGCIEYVDSSRSHDGYVITAVGEARLQALAKEVGS